MKTFLLLILLGLSGCSWFHRAKAVPVSPQLVVTGAPAGSEVFVDDVKNGQTAEVNGKPQVLNVASGYARGGDPRGQHRYLSRANLCWRR